MTALPAVMPLTIGKTISRSASDQAGKVVAAASVCTENRLDWRDIAPSANCRDQLAFCALNAARLHDRERNFLATLARWCEEPTEKPLDWLQTIGSKLRSDA
jgi:hypothetical protein